MIELSTEQRLSLELRRREVEQMNESEAKAALVAVYKNWLLLDAEMRPMLKKEWGIA